MIWLGITAAVALFVLAMALSAYSHSIQVSNTFHFHPHTKEWCLDPANERLDPTGCLIVVYGQDIDADAPQEALAIILTAAVMALLVREIDRKAARTMEEN